jgi:hypothetical protein
VHFLLETVIQAISTLIILTYGKRGPISRITLQEECLLPIGYLIILLAPRTWEQSLSHCIKHHPSKPLLGIHIYSSSYV